MHGERIGHEEFLGPRYDFQRQGLVVQSMCNRIGQLFFYLDAPVPANIIPPSSVSGRNRLCVCVLKPTVWNTTFGGGN